MQSCSQAHQADQAFRAIPQTQGIQTISQETFTLGGGKVCLDKTIVCLTPRNLISRTLERYSGHLEPFGVSLTFFPDIGPLLPGRCLLPWTTTAEPLDKALSTWYSLSLLIFFPHSYLPGSGFWFPSSGSC